MYRKRIYKVNEDYFKKIDTQDKAYWLGYLYADGNIHNGKSPYVNLTSKDKSILQKFKNSLSSEHIIRKRNDNDKSIRFYISIGSKIMVLDLIKLGVIPNKTFKITFPDFKNKTLIRHFIRGFFDGDGWITYFYDKNKDFRKYFGIASGSYIFIKQLNKYLQNSMIINNNSIYKARNCFIITYTKWKDLRKIYNYLYSNSSIYLSRKYKIFKKVFTYLQREKK